jgi:hypothetical protein
MDESAREVPHRLGASELNRTLVLIEAGLTHEAAEILLGAETLCAGNDSGKT